MSDFPCYPFPHHNKVGPCFTRPAYRDGRKKRAVKVFTIATESTHLLIFGVPSIHLDQNLREKCKQFGSVEKICKLADYPDQERFTEAFLVKLDTIHNARRAKRSLDGISFYGGCLHVCYAPEYETIAECRLKLHACRRNNARTARKAEFEYIHRISKKTDDAVLPSSTTFHSGSMFYSQDIETSSAINETPSGSSSNVSISVTPATTSQDRSPLCGPVQWQTAGDTDGSDALDDARQYWANIGADFSLISHQPPPLIISSTSSNCATSTGTASTSRQPEVPSIQPTPSAQASSHLPVAVQQAMTWRPYRLPQTGTVVPPNHPAKEPTDNSRNILVPRCLQRVRRAVSKVSAQSPEYPLLQVNRDKHQESKGCDAATLSVGRLKELAMTLGPVAGPSRFSPFERTAVKRIIFHNHQDTKRRRLENCDEHDQFGPSGSNR